MSKNKQVLTDGANDIFTVENLNKARISLKSTMSSAAEQTIEKATISKMPQDDLIELGAVKINSGAKATADVDYVANALINRVFKPF